MKKKILLTFFLGLFSLISMASPVYAKGPSVQERKAFHCEKKKACYKRVMSCCEKNLNCCREGSAGSDNESVKNAVKTTAIILIPGAGLYFLLLGLI